MEDSLTTKLLAPLEGDHLVVRDLATSITLAEDAWGRPKAQPACLTLFLWLPLARSGSLDSLSHSLSYSTAAKKGLALLSSREIWPSVAVAASTVATDLSSHFGGIRTRVIIEAGNAALEVQGLGAQAVLDPSSPLHALSFLHALRVRAIIGINPWERESKQTVLLDIHALPASISLPYLAKHIGEWVEDSSYRTVEALASSISSLALSLPAPEGFDRVQDIVVRVEKPSALAFAAGAGVQIRRFRSSLEADPSADEVGDLPPPIPSSSSITTPSHVCAYIALGANIGKDPAKNLADALIRLAAHPEIRVTNTSFLYLTAPMYLLDQPSFYNAACEISTSLSPHALLKALKEIEGEMGRDVSGGAVRMGPRLIDLDILLYHDTTLQSDTLTIPHASLPEREFVLRPLCDIAAEVHHPKSGQSMRALLRDLEVGEGQALRVWPMGGGKVWKEGEPTHVMAILNATPDSFSDGGKWTALDRAADHVASLVASGADCIDVGGMSTRPGAAHVSEEEEIHRVLPLIQHIAATFPDVVISIDTFRSTVAEAALRAGATWVNDVTGGIADPRILPLVAASATPICIMHSRGDPQTMNSLTDYDRQGGVLPGVMAELDDRVNAAIAAGIPRWLIWLDPGLGFAKTYDQSCELVRRMDTYISASSPLLAGFPWLIAPSRKRFIGQATGKEKAEERDWGTAAVCTEAVRAGAMCLRIHRVDGLIDAIRMSDALFRKVDKE